MFYRYMIQVSRPTTSAVHYLTTASTLHYIHLSHNPGTEHEECSTTGQTAGEGEENNIHLI